MKTYRINGDRGDIRLEQVDGLATTERSFVITGEDLLCSDGYHTMDELYDHRVQLYIALCRHINSLREEPVDTPPEVWRSRLHHDGTSFDGWFVLGVGVAQGEQITYHLPEARWNDCDFAETLERAPKFDGHTSADVLKRLADI